MSHSTDRRRQAGRGSDQGFTLIEVVVALGIVTTVMIALLPQLVVGIRSTDTARLVTQAKGVTQGQLERMRNLPFHVAPAAGDYRDVLDYYFRDTSPPSTTPACMTGARYAVPQNGWKGYVSSSARCSYEPGSGAFYRYVMPTDTDGFVVVVDAQFLSGATPPAVVTPVNYDTQITGKDAPASSQIGVTVTVLYSQRATLRPVSTYTQIADEPSPVSRIKANADAIAVEIGSESKADGPISFDAGLLSLRGALTYTSTAGAVLAGTSAALATGVKASGASTSRAAPPSQAASSVPQSPGGLAGSCTLVCWGNTTVDAPSVTSDVGLPIAGSAVSPAQSLLTSNTNGGFAFNNGAVADYRPELGLGANIPISGSPAPLVRVDPVTTAQPSGLNGVCKSGGTGASSYVTASGFVRSTAVDASTSPSSVESCAFSRSSTVALFPTSFAPRGVVQVDLEMTSARCVLSGSAHTSSVTYDYRAKVRYKKPDTDSSSYQEAVDIRPGLSPDPLADPTLLKQDVGGGHVLGDYVASWSSVLDGQLTQAHAAGTAAMKIPGVLKIITQPVRTGDDVLPVTASASPSITTSATPTTAPTATASPSPTATALPTASPTATSSPTPSPAGVDLASALSLTFGAVSCSAEDSR